MTGRCHARGIGVSGPISMCVIPAHIAKQPASQRKSSQEFREHCVVTKETIQAVHTPINRKRLGPCQPCPGEVLAKWPRRPWFELIADSAAVPGDEHACSM